LDTIQASDIVTILSGGQVVTPDDVLRPGWVRLSDQVIAEVGSGDPPERPDLRFNLDGDWLVPGFVDLHVHGGNGGSYFSGDAVQVRRAARFHLSHGTTSSIASLVSAPLADLTRAISVAAEVVSEGLLAGVHLEGPYLSAQHRGAHPRAFLRKPDSGELATLLTAGCGTVKQVTVAPELPGAIALIRAITEAGVVAAVGHTNATYQQAQAAFTAGASLATHLFNGMRPPHHREPGPVVAALENDQVTLELIADSIHVHEAVMALVFAQAGADRIALVTDAMPPAGLRDGVHNSGSATFRVTGSSVILEPGGALAGSTLTMDRALRRVVFGLGVPMIEAVRAASTTPARVIGLASVGSIAAGKRADLVVLTNELRVRAVMTRGQWQLTRATSTSMR
jgi:N-acetylglucosamine-6-phosphate deacetylase